MAVMDRAMEPRMHGVSLCGHVGNQTLGQMSGVKDVVVVTKESEIVGRYTLLA